MNVKDEFEDSTGVKNTKLSLFIYAREEINGQNICGNSVYRPIKPQAFFCKTIFIVTDVTSGERTAFSGVHVARPLVYCLVSCRSLFFLVSFIRLSLCCLSSFEFTDSDFPIFHESNKQRK
jgi:hypothetical protein